MDEIGHAAERCEHFNLNCERYHQQLYSYTLRKACNKADAEEITNEAILRFIESMKRQEWPEIKDIMAYLRKIVRTIFAERGGRSKEVQLEGNGDEQSEQIHKALESKAVQENNPTNDILNAIYNKEMWRKLVETILADLSEDDWRLLKMYLEGMNAEEIAAALGIDVHRVRWELNKILARIRYRGRQSE